jgi:hypothetical protein
METMSKVSQTQALVMRGYLALSDNEREWVYDRAQRLHIGSTTKEDVFREMIGVVLGPLGHPCPCCGRS